MRSVLCVTCNMAAYLGDVVVYVGVWRRGGRGRVVGAGVMSLVATDAGCCQSRQQLWWRQFMLGTAGFYLQGLQHQIWCGI